MPEEQRQRLVDASAVGPADSEAQDDEEQTGRARPVPGLVEPDEINPDVVPAGSIKQILDWVGKDLARARVAADMERAKGLNARSGLLDKLAKVAAGEESDPPKVPESFVDDGTVVAPAPAGGVAEPNEDLDEVTDKPAKKTSASRR
ncbi:hypothetical protein [Micromonospora zhanjiangensis]